MVWVNISCVYKPLNFTLAVDLCIIHKMLVLHNIQTTELWGHGGFHPDFTGSHVLCGRIGVPISPWKCNVWSCESEAKSSAEIPGSQRCQESWTAAEGNWGQQAQPARRVRKQECCNQQGYGVVEEAAQVLKSPHLTTVCPRHSCSALVWSLSAISCPFLLEGECLPCACSTTVCWKYWICTFFFLIGAYNK